MAKIIKGTFTDNGSSETFLASKLTVLAGSDGGSNFGGGTLNVEVSHDGVLFTTASALTEESTKTIVDSVGGLLCKLTLSGATSPDLDYSVKYELIDHIAHLIPLAQLFLLTGYLFPCLNISLRGRQKGKKYIHRDDHRIALAPEVLFA